MLAVSHEGNVSFLPLFIQLSLCPRYSTEDILTPAYFKTVTFFLSYSFWSCRGSTASLGDFLKRKWKHVVFLYGIIFENLPTCHITEETFSHVFFLTETGAESFYFQWLNKNNGSLVASCLILFSHGSVIIWQCLWETCVPRLPVPTCSVLFSTALFDFFSPCYCHVATVCLLFSSMARARSRKTTPGTVCFYSEV